ncbi:hypothetical protein CDAR_303761 [Caerostris darwini]|uniref:Uncharacterized protein n=1 Tax=Caerostris darwini TaxID=1538125 RepID=A0AAV4T3N2_9ARAC|nr:hypothetical protein CDAR_303761 [Caerostris darwini]
MQQDVDPFGPPVCRQTAEGCFSAPNERVLSDVPRFMILEYRPPFAWNGMSWICKLLEVDFIPSFRLNLVCWNRYQFLDFLPSFRLNLVC